MLIILKKTIYILIIVALNLYVCTYLVSKLSSRTELRRGYRMTRIGGIGFPAIRFLSYLGRRRNIDIWIFLLFIFSLLIWTVVPINPDLVLVDMDSSLLAAILFIIIIIVLNLAGQLSTRYGLIMGQATRKMIMVLSLIIPVFLSAISIILVNRTLGFKEVVSMQHAYWNVVYQPLGFIICLVSIALILRILEPNRKGTLEAASLSSYEGNGISRMIIRFSEYTVVIFLVYMTVLLYLGGYKNLFFIKGEIMLGIKFYAVFVFLLFVGRTLGSITDYRLLLRINFKFLIPLALGNLAVTLSFFIARNIYGLV
ncbi:MAG: NADH-quinone oxidoreductase subunit H [Actinobacteria bacterium]|nr:NADH-quinone oxidoreductase subunit H [Actinomycetota bacterium]